MMAVTIVNNGRKEKQGKSRVKKRKKTFFYNYM